MIQEPKPVDPEAQCFLRVPAKCIDTVIESLHSAGYPQEAEAVAQFTAPYTDPNLNAARERWLALAREQIEEEGELEFDDDATISQQVDTESGNGQFVLGWVWVVDTGDEEEASPESVLEAAKEVNAVVTQSSQIASEVRFDLRVPRKYIPDFVEALRNAGFHRTAEELERFM
jgi:hypothetical protein